ncbi:MAG: NfeD family protein, partial [Hyphomicrobiaceae bacterium]
MTWHRAILHLLPAIIAGLIMFAASGTGAQNSNDTAGQGTKVHVIQVKGAIGVGTGVMMAEALENASEAGAGLLVIELDTPGGLVAATREIIQSILASPVPVAVFVSPSGARAASAGTYIAYAAHVVGMAPGTHLGAATPVSMTMPGMPQQPQQPGQPKTDDKSKPSDGKTAMERKVLNDAIAYLRSLAQLRGRSEKWAEKFVRDASTLTAKEAKKEGIIDVVASDVADLLRQIDGRVVKTTSGEKTLDVRSAEVQNISPGWKVKFLTAITDPNIAFILLLVGFYGILFEFWSPGLTGPGVIGGISLVLALFALSALPLSYAGLALLLLGLALMVGEAVAPGFGILGIGGVIAFILGAIFLFDPAGADIDFSIYTPLIVAAAATSALLLIGILGFLMRSRRATVTSGSEQMIGAQGEVVSWNDGSGTIRVHGEIWSARSAGSMEPGRM